MRTYGQTIVYAVHESAGHLGIFVSGSVAKKEYQEFASNIDMIDVLPPGLYEAVMIKRPASDLEARNGPNLIGGDYFVRFETHEVTTSASSVQTAATMTADSKPLPGCRK